MSPKYDVKEVAQVAVEAGVWRTIDLVYVEDSQHMILFRVEDRPRAARSVRLVIRAIVEPTEFRRDSGVPWIKVSGLNFDDHVMKCSSSVYSIAMAFGYRQC